MTDLANRVKEFVAFDGGPAVGEQHFINGTEPSKRDIDMMELENARLSPLLELLPEVVAFIENRNYHNHSDLFDCDACALLAKIEQGCKGAGG